MKIFISHAHSDIEWVTRFAEALRAQGFELWLDEKIGSGEDWKDRALSTLKALEESEALVPVFRQQEPSPHVLTEVGMALAQGKQVLPVIAGKSPDIPALTDLANVQAVHARQATVAAAQIASALRVIAAAKSESSASTTVRLIKPPKK
jgi:TIR domain